MNALARVALLACAFSFTYLSVKAADVPGGAVFVENGNIVYHDFKTAEKINLTSGINKQFSANTNFAVSGDGITLFWADENSKIWVASPNVKPMPVTIYMSGTAGSNGLSSIWLDLIIPGAKNLVCSFTGQKLSIEYPKTSKFSTDFCNAIVYAQIDRNAGETRDAVRADGITVGKAEYGIDAGKIWWQCNFCGNTAEPLASLASGKKLITVNGLSYLPEQAIPRFGIKRNAYFGCWSKDMIPNDQRFALIYQTKLGWGPIEIRDKPGYGDLISKYCQKKSKTVNLTGEEYKLKSGLYEIPTRLANCDGLAFKPDGSLTCFAGDKFYVIKKKDIEAGISQSGIEEYPDIGFSVAPRNNVFTVRPEVFAIEQGSGHYWVTDDQLVFRNREGNLRLWENGKSETIMDSVPATFHCCNHPPFSQNIESSGVMSGESVATRYGATTASPIIVGDIKFAGVGAWSALKPQHDYNGVLSIYKKNLEFALLKELNIDQITDPTKYEYQPAPSSVRVRVPGAINQVGIEIHSVRVPFNSVVMLRLNGKYGAIQPIAYREKSRPMDREKLKKITKNSRKEAKKGTSIPSGKENVFEELTYKWKAWPEIPTRQMSSRIAQNK